MNEKSQSSVTVTDEGYREMVHNQLILRISDIQNLLVTLKKRDDKPLGCYELSNMNDELIAAQGLQDLFSFKHSVITLVKSDITMLVYVLGGADRE